MLKGLDLKDKFESDGECWEGQGKPEFEPTEREAMTGKVEAAGQHQSFIILQYLQKVRVALI